MMTAVLHAEAHMIATDTSYATDYGMPSLSTDDLNSLRLFIHDECGIKLPPTKKVMLESRLHKRLRILGMKSFRQYREYLFSDEGKARELTHCIDAVTTNKTDFFREDSHFEYLVTRALPALLDADRRRLTIWSAGCSTGEEPYTLIQDKIDIIFCRNVIIYFDKPTQERLMNKFCRHLVPDGFLFLGHSETLNSMQVPLVSAAPTIYRRLS